MQDNVLDTIDKVALGKRLLQARRKKELESYQVCQRTFRDIGLFPRRLFALEDGHEQITPHELITLAHLYEVQLYQLLNPLPEGLTHKDILAMYVSEEISEGVACHELGVDLLDLRTLVEYTQRKEIGHWVQIQSTDRYNGLIGKIESIEPQGLYPYGVKLEGPDLLTYFSADELVISAHPGEQKERKS